MNNTIPDIGWLEVTPEAFDIHAINGINDLSYRKERTFQFAGEAPLQPEQVVAIKLGVFATNDLPFWTSEEIENTGSRVVYAPGINGNLSIGPDGVGIARAYHYEPTLGGIVRSRLSGVKAPVDSVQSEDVTRKLAGLGVVTLFQPDHLARTTKDKTKEIAISAGVNSPFSRCCANVVFPNSLFRELSETGYREFVIKPNNGVQGDEVEFLDLDLGHDDFDPKVEGKSDVIIEQRIIPKLLNIDGVEHDWNIRSVVLEGGQVGWYVRACAMGGPVNISKGAFLLTQDELSNYLPEMINLDSKVKEFSEKVGSVLPEGLIAVDIIVNKNDGELYLIEVNTGNIVCTSYPDYPDPKAISIEERQSVADNLVKGYKKAALRQSDALSEEISVDFDNGESRVEVALDYISKILSDGDTNYGVYLLLDVLDYIKKISSNIDENARQYLIGRTLHTARIIDYYSDKKNDEMHRFVFVELASAGLIQKDEVGSILGNEPKLEPVLDFMHLNPEYLLSAEVLKPERLITLLFAKRAEFMQPKHNRVEGIVSRIKDTIVRTYASVNLINEELECSENQPVSKEDAAQIAEGVEHYIELLVEIISKNYIGQEVDEKDLEKAENLFLSLSQGLSVIGMDEDLSEIIFELRNSKGGDIFNPIVWSIFIETPPYKYLFLTISGLLENKENIENYYKEAKENEAEHLLPDMKTFKSAMTLLEQGVETDIVREFIQNSDRNSTSFQKLAYEILILCADATINKVFNERSLQILSEQGIYDLQEYSRHFGPDKDTAEEEY